MAAVVFCVSACIFVGCGSDNRLEQDAPSLLRSNLEVSGQTLTINGFENAKYSKDGGESWSENNSFAALKFDTTYNICVMYAENEEYRASPSSNVISVKIARPAALTPIIRDENIQMDGNRVAIVGFENASYSSNNGESWTENNVFSNLINGKTYQFRVRINETDTTAQSEPSRIREITIPKLSRSAPLLESSKVIVNASEGVISVVGFGSEAVYSIDGGKTYQTEPFFENLTQGQTYLIAVKYLETKEYSESPWSNIIHRIL